jgi:hypothetical protein
LTGLKLKFLWDTLDHYLLVKRIGSALWREKAITLSLAGLIGYYFGGIRQAYFMDPSRDYIWVQAKTREYDNLVREKSKAAVSKEVLANEELPAKVAPLLVNLVQMPRI